MSSRSPRDRQEILAQLPAIAHCPWMAKNVLAYYAEVLVTVTYEVHVEKTIQVKALCATQRNACWTIRQKSHGD